MKRTLFGVLTTAIVSNTLIPGVQAISIGNPGTAHFSHVLIISIDGLHNSDLSVANLQSSLKNIKRLQREGVTYTNAFTCAPS
ncbi:hypothetical protein, partial [Nostoc sp.]|uniref:hypothetical protein n=1 Tax=Nostoc sp. TaxID=1180 RepID=UPI002FFB4840